MIRPLQNRTTRVLYKTLVGMITAGLLPPIVHPTAVWAQGLPPAPQQASSAPAGAEKLILLNFRDSPLDQVLEFVADLIGRTLIRSPGINATITLKSQTRLTVREAMQAIEAVLAMNNVTLVPMGDKFLKVVQTTAARQEGMPLNVALPEDQFPETDALISQVISLKYTELAEITPIIQSLLHGYGKIQPLERANSLLVTDTAVNMRRVMEVLEMIDQPVESKVETRIYTIRFAKASEIASRLNELIAESQAKEDRPRVDPAQAGAGAQVPAAIAALRPRAATPEAEAAAVAAAAERGIIAGKVKIIADERTNILFVISRAENFVFFDRIVDVLDRPVDPAIAVRVIALEYAKAEEIASILNEFIGAASAEKGTGAPEGAAAPTGDAADNRSQALRDFIQQRVQQRPAQTAENEEATGSFGRLSSTTKILADKRTNSLLLMGRKSDLDALLEVIDSLDIMLAQVLIEAVILEVNLGNGIESGVDWLQRSVTAYQEQIKGPRGGLGLRQPVYSFGGGSVMSSGDGSFRAGNSLLTQADGNAALGSGALTYYLTFFDLNIDAVIRLAASSRDARILSTPVVLTTDNTEAKINIGEERPVVTSTSTTDTGTQTQNFQYRSIGIDLAVTPRINPQRYVVMEVAQKADNVGGFEMINGNRVPVITKREINAQIAVQSRNTIVLGGLVSTDKTRTRTKIPLLGDIPLLGALFRSDTRDDARTELLVLITPYVLLTPDEARQETVRLHDRSTFSKSKWRDSWSDSELPRLSREETDQILKDRESVQTPGLMRELFSGNDATTNDTPVRRDVDLTPETEPTPREVPEDAPTNPSTADAVVPQATPTPSVVSTDAPPADSAAEQASPAADAAAPDTESAVNRLVPRR